jgi:hypothetical protein
MGSGWGRDAQTPAPDGNWSTPPSDDPAMAPFERAARQIAEEERRLRGLAEERLRELLRLLVDVASAHCPAALDAASRADPFFLARATAADWRRLLLATPRPGPTAEPTGWRDAEAGPEVTRLREEVRRLEAELAALRPARTTAGGEDAGAERAPGPAATLTTLPIAEQLLQAELPPGKDEATPEEDASLTLAAGPLTPVLPPLPRDAPGRFADQLRNWPREALALVALGVTGWSMRQAVAEVMAEHLQKVQSQAGSFRRVFHDLARRRFWVALQVVVQGLRPLEEAEALDQPTTLIVVRLTDLGKDVVRACGIEPVPSEWELLAAREGPGVAPARIGSVSTFAYQARRRGWQTVVCPEAAPEADLALRRAGETTYVLVAGAEPPTEALLQRGHGIAQRGSLGLVAITPAGRRTLIDAAQAAGIPQGAATDLQTLIDGQAANSPLWPDTWSP